MIYQELALAPHLSVAENIVLGMEPVFGPFMAWGRARRMATDAMAQLGPAGYFRRSLVQRLSVADRQLVEIGRAVAIGCSVLVLDEPTSSLTQADTVRLFDLVRRLKGTGSRHHLHLACAGRSEGNLRSVRLCYATA